MIRKLLYTILFALSAMNINAQNIGIIGTFNSWSADAVMNTTDNVTYTLQNFTFLVSGELKFRQDGAWANNWGGVDFPSGVGTQGAANIPVSAGTYDVTFNIITGAYSFVAVFNNFDVIGFNGGFNNFGPAVPMATLDGIAYKKMDYHFDGDGVKFVRDEPAPTTIWGNTTFPSGNATLDGPTIPLTAGFYNVDFNKNTLAYNFVPVPVSIIGDAIIDFNTDFFMTTTDGINFTLSGLDLIAGNRLKFRANGSWDTNWGGTAFPMGSGVLGGVNEIIVDISGTYEVIFNRLTGAYAFTLITNTFPIISINGTVMQTINGVNYKLVNQSFSGSNLVQFKDPINSTTYWGASAFPSGTAVIGSSDAITVPTGFYTVTFNRTTGAYSFLNTNSGSISLIGAFNGWINDVVLNTNDNITYTLQNFTLLVTGGLKFRQDGAWAINWGGGDFPSGVATLGGPDFLGLAGTYDVTFNRVTGAYSFVQVNGNYDLIGFKGGFNNFGATVPMVTADGITYIKTDYHFTGDGVKFVRDTPAPATIWGNTTFPSGNAALNGTTIPLTAGFYNVDFNKNTLAYNFVPVPVSIIGDAAIDFATDIDMTTTDGINFTLNNQSLIGGKHLKFRANHNWTTNWGGNGFPTGIAVISGFDDIIVYNTGNYNISFNRVTGDYVFTLLTSVYPTVSNNGSVMQTTDGIIYNIVDQYFDTTTLAQFNDSTNPNTVWGATAFPSGIAIAGSTDQISVPAGFYNVTFDRTTGAYSYTAVPVSLTGIGITDWGTDLNLDSTDNGINSSKLNVVFVGGDVRFRVNAAWTTSWGGTAFPIGTGTTTNNGSGNIPVPPGTYDVFFNRLTGDYVFTLLPGVYPVVSNNGMVMQTTNGVVYTSPNQSFTTTTQVQFNDPTNPNTVWGATAFPSGTAVAGSPDKIAVPPGFFNLNFNRTTGAYNYTVVPISIIGPGISDWNTNVTLDSADYGINSSKMNVVFVGGDIKFRANADATTSWGGSTTFPSGTATTTGAGNITVPAGTYSVSFNRITGIYSFSILSTTSFEKSGLALYPNPATATFAINGAFDKVQVYSITGQLVKTFTKTIENQNLNIADLNSGLYFVKAVDASNIEKTSKLIKQ